MWRSANLNDDDAIMAMCLGLFQEDPGPHPVPKEHIRNTLDVFRRDSSRGKAYLLEIDGAPAGYALLAFFWSNELGGEIATIDELYVKPNFRSQGHSTRFIQALIKKDPTIHTNHVAIDLEVTPKNDRAKKLYESLGFKPAKNTHMRLRFPL